MIKCIFFIFNHESTWKSQESSSNSKHADILSCYIINREIYKDRIYDVATENEVIDLQNESWFLKNHFFKWTHFCVVYDATFYCFFAW